MRIPGTDAMYIRRFESGAISFRYRPTLITGERPWITIGEFPAMSLATANDEYDRMVQEVAKGLDLRLERKRREEEARVQAQRTGTRKITIREIVAEWIWFDARANRKATRSMRLITVDQAQPRE